MTPTTSERTPYPKFDGTQACAGTNLETWFATGEPGSLPVTERKKAIRVCHDCTFITECREWAIQWTDLAGIWGGTNEKERQRIRQENNIRGIPLVSLIDQLLPN